MIRLDDRVAIVTGAAAGVGRGIAQVLAVEGACVVLADVDEEGAAAAAGTLVAAGHRAIGVQVDVSHRAATDAMAAAALDAFGRIDILAANAGIYPVTPLASMTDADWDRVMNVNVKGALHAIQSCLPAMLSQGSGSIVLTSSVTGPITGYPGFAHYGASKAAMLGMMRSIAIELARRDVTINAVLPGNVRTEGLDGLGDDHVRKMLAAIPMGAFAEPEDVGWAVRFLASPEAHYITGQTLVIDGGQVLPESQEALAEML